MRKGRRAYILILPSLFTTGNLFCGFYSIVQSIHGQFFQAAVCVLVAVIFDILDGRVARMTRTQSRFGVEYDSISDVVSFALAPAFLAYLWDLQAFGRLGVAVAFFYAACGALRLARFNTIAEDMPKSYFVGLPSPAAALFIAALAISNQELEFPNPAVLLFPALISLGLLMVSNVRYRSFKDFDVRHRRQFVSLVFLLIGLIFLIIKPDLGLLSIMSYYVGTGVIRELVGFFSRRASTQKMSAVERRQGVE